MRAMRILMLAVLTALPVSPLVVCSCAGPFPVCQAVGKSAAVFTGTVVAIEEPVPPVFLPSSVQQAGPRDARRDAKSSLLPLTPPVRLVKIRVRDVLSGVEAGQKEVEIATGRGGGDCGYSFQVNEDYVIYAYRTKEGRLETGICSRTRPLRDAAEDIAYFRAMESAPATAELRVSTAYPGTPAKPGVTIVAERAGSRASATTDAKGEAHFPGLPTGEYAIHAQEDGDLPDDPKIRLYARGCGDVMLIRSMRITGRVTTREGLPAARIEIDVRSLQGNDGNGAMTDMDGRYEIRISRPGQYHVGVSLNRTPTRGTPYPTWFFPGTSDPAQAALIDFTGKPAVHTFDVILPGRQRERAIEGVVLRRDGRPMERAVVTVFDDSGNGVAQGFADQNGRFAVQVFVGIPYQLHAAWSGDKVDPAVSAVPLEIKPSDENMSLRLSLTQPGNSAIDKMQQRFGRRQ